MKFVIAAAAFTWTTAVAAQEPCSQQGARAAYEAFLADGPSGRRGIPERFVFPEYEKASVTWLRGCTFAIKGVMASSNPKMLDLRFEVEIEYDEATGRWVQGQLKILSGSKSNSG